MTNAPKDLKYTKTHEWLRLIDNETAQIGITEHAQSLLGDMVFVELPQVGSEVEANAEIGVLESVKAAADFYAPISGTIIEINNEILNNPAAINKDPYKEGWLVKIKPSKLEELDVLLDAEKYDAIYSSH